MNHQSLDKMPPEPPKRRALNGDRVVDRGIFSLGLGMLVVPASVRP